MALLEPVKVEIEVRMANLAKQLKNRINFVVAVSIVTGINGVWSLVDHILKLFKL